MVTHLIRRDENTNGSCIFHVPTATNCFASFKSDHTTGGSSEWSVPYGCAHFGCRQCRGQPCFQRSQPGSLHHQEE